MNNTYRKPLILAENELAEGVYTASGSGSASYTVTAVYAKNWPDGITFSMNIDASSAGDNWSVTLTVSGGTPTAVSVADQRLNATLSGNTIKITPAGTGASTYNVEFYGIWFTVEGETTMTVS